MNFTKIDIYALNWTFLKFGLPVFLAAVAVVLWSQRRQKLPLPAGPPSQGPAGNVKQLPSSHSWKTFREWSRTYGPVIYFRVFTRDVVVLNTAKAVNDLLDRRSHIYSNRPKQWMYQELVGRKHVVFAESFEHPRFRRYRKELTSALNTRSIKEYHDIMSSETRVFLQLLASSPEDFISHIRRNAGAIIMKVTYGYSVSGDNDYFVELVKRSFEISEQAVKTGRWLVDFFPIMRFIPSWFPGANFQTEAKRMREELDKLSGIPHQWVKDQMARRDYIESFTSRLLQPYVNGYATLDAEEDDIIKCIAAGLYVGGADTTVSALTTFFLAMCLYPDVQRKAQAEIDEVIGRDRLPSFADRDTLPYFKAVMKEVFRWSPVTPLGLPHSVIQDDVYEGNRIPSGATVIANIWALMYDESVYPDPSIFDPERHLKSNFQEPSVDPYNFAFGFGRRICPGLHFAQDSLFLTMTSVLSAFVIGRVKNEAGEEVIPEFEVTSAVTSHIKPFKCSITARVDAEMLFQ